MNETRILEPTRVAQGEEIEWTRTFEDHPASLWTLEYRFRGPAAGWNITADADGNGFHAELESASTTGKTLGRWMWQAWATEIVDSDHVEMIASGFMTLIRGFATIDAGTAVELRSAAKIAYDAITAALTGTATNDQIEYEVSTPSGMRRVKRMSRIELISLQKHFATIVRRENLAERVRNGGPFMTPVNVRINQ